MRDRNPVEYQDVGMKVQAAEVRLHVLVHLGTHYGTYGDLHEDPGRIEVLDESQLPHYSRIDLTLRLC